MSSITLHTQASFLACLFRALKDGQLNFICILSSLLLPALTFLCLHLATIARNRLRHWHLWNATFFPAWRYIQLVTVAFSLALFSGHVVRGRVTVSGADSRAASQQWPSTSARTHLARSFTNSLGRQGEKTVSSGR